MLQKPNPAEKRRFHCLCKKCRKTYNVSKQKKKQQLLKETRSNNFLVCFYLVFAGWLCDVHEVYDIRSTHTKSQNQFQLNDFFNLFHDVAEAFTVKIAFIVFSQKQSHVKSQKKITRVLCWNSAWRFHSGTALPNVSVLPLSPSII